MPPLPEAGLAERDRLLPGLATLFDPDAFAEALARSCPGTEIGPPEITWVAYSPQSYCVVSYRFSAGGRTVDGYARAFRHDERDRALASLAKRAVDTPLGPGWIVWERLAVLVSIFPNDLRLRRLARLMDPVRRARLVRQLLPHRAESDPGRLETLRYKPERRFVGRLTGRHDALALKLKLYPRSTYPDAWRNALAFTSSGPLRVVRPVGSRDYVIAFEWLPGQLLSTVLRNGDASAPGTMQMVGAALARLHAQDAAGLGRRDRNVDAASLRAAARKIAFLWPRTGMRATALADRLARAIVDRPEVHRPIHGDFCAKQVLMDGETVIVLDFDCAAKGDPSIDLGLFVAHLERDACCGLLPPDRVDLLRESLLEGYRSHAGTPPGGIDLYTAVGLLRVALDVFRDREPDWPERIERLVMRAEAIAERAGERAAVLRLAARQ